MKYKEHEHEHEEQPDMRGHFIRDGLKVPYKLYVSRLPNTEKQRWPIHQKITNGRKLWYPEMPDSFNKAITKEDEQISNNQAIITYGVTNASLTSTHYKPAFKHCSLFYYPYEVNRVRTNPMEVKQFNDFSGWTINPKAIDYILQWAESLEIAFDVTYDRHKFTEKDLFSILNQIKQQVFGIAIKTQCNLWLDELYEMRHPFCIDLDNYTHTKRTRILKGYKASTTRRDREIARWFRDKIDVASRQLKAYDKKNPRHKQRRQEIKAEIKQYKQWVDRLIARNGETYDDHIRECKDTLKFRTLPQDQEQQPKIEGYRYITKPVMTKNGIKQKRVRIDNLFAERKRLCERA